MARVMSHSAQKCRISCRIWASKRKWHDKSSSDTTCSPRNHCTRRFRNGEVAERPAWEDCIVWKNKEAYIARLRQMAEGDSPH